MVEASILNHNDMAMDQVAPKSEPLNEGSISSAVSTPDPEGEVLTQDVAQTQKRKGGRKPVRKNHRHPSGGGCPFLYVFFFWLVFIAFISLHSFYLSTAALICWPYLLTLFFYLAPWSECPGPRIPAFSHLSFSLIIPYLLPMSALFSFVLT